MRAGIALGANLGDRLLSLTTARAMIFALPGVSLPHLSSAIYETTPIECEPGAGKFLNAAVEVGYEDEPFSLLRALQQIERTLGRPTDHEPNRSRPIDLDLLYHGSRVSHEAPLLLPHPRMHRRGFVLLPLAEIRPDLALPGMKKTIGELSAELAQEASVVRAAQQW